MFQPPMWLQVVEQWLWLLSPMTYSYAFLNSLTTIHNPIDHLVVSFLCRNTPCIYACRFLQKFCFYCMLCCSYRLLSTKILIVMEPEQNALNNIRRVLKLIEQLCVYVTCTHKVWSFSADCIWSDNIIIISLLVCILLKPLKWYTILTRWVDALQFCWLVASFY